MSPEHKERWVADPPIRRALLSVSDKEGLIELALGLRALDVELWSTGGSASHIRAAGIEVRAIESITGFPEILDGRVKTLHPAVHAALLARRECATHLEALDRHGIASIDLIAVNFYPFEDFANSSERPLEETIEQIDIGGPAMVRSAAKNWRGVAVLTSPRQYTAALENMRHNHRRRGIPVIGAGERFRLAVAAFEAVTAYDAAVSNFLGSVVLPAEEEDQALPTVFCGERPQRTVFPSQRSMCFVKVRDLRYGENPHQRAALYRDLAPVPGSIVGAKQLQGKELSFNNLADADTAWDCVQSFERPSCVIVKHANPCGVASGNGPLEAYRKAFACDPTSAFGGVIAFNRKLDAVTAEALNQQFLEVLIAPDLSEEALARLSSKTALRVLRIACASEASNPKQGRIRGEDLKRIGSGLLVQDADTGDILNNGGDLGADTGGILNNGADLGAEAWRCVTHALPSKAQTSDLLFAWRVAKFLKSNAIVFARDEQTLGLGAGQMSRLDAARIARYKAQDAGLGLEGSVAASDAFFPFRDGLEVLADAGACAVIQPGGSIRDHEVIEAADARGLAMVFTGVRHFRH